MFACLLVNGEFLFQDPKGARYSLIESCKLNKVNPLNYMTYLLANARNKNKLLLLPTEYDGSNIAHIG